MIEKRDALTAAGADDGLVRIVAIQEGRAASQRAELFAPGALTWPESGIPIRAEHFAPSSAMGSVVRRADGRIEVAAEASPELREAIADGRTSASIEFHAVEEHRTAGGVREITAAELVGVGLTSAPEYVQTSAELRNAKRVLPWL